MSPAAHQHDAAKQPPWAVLLPWLLSSLFAADLPASGRWWATDTVQDRQQQRYLCTLLQVSKAWQAAVGTCCKGQLAITLSPRSLKQAESFAKWLSNPGMASGLHMMKSLNLDFSVPTQDYRRQHAVDKALLVEMQALVAQALKSAAAWIVPTPAPAAAAGGSAHTAASSSTAAAGAPPPTAPATAAGGQPALCEVDIKAASTGLVEALALPGCQVTRLRLWFGGSSDWSHDNMQQLGEALQSLTGLKTLALVDYDNVADEDGEYMGVDDLVPSLSGLVALTSPAIQDYDTSLHLPSQLCELTYSRFDVEEESDAAYASADDDRYEGVVLGSLTSLTKLVYYGGTTGHSPAEYDPSEEYGDFRRKVLGNDVLPPDLLELHVPYCHDLECVPGCSKLQALHLECCRASNEQLQQLSVLTSLAEVNVEFCRIERCPVSGSELYYAADSADSWVSIPLRSLAFEVDLAAAASGSSNASTSSSTSSEGFIGGQNSQWNCEQARKLLSQLGHQTGLTQLALGVHLDPSEAPGVFMQLGLLADPLKRLTSLQELTVHMANCRLPEEIYEWEDRFACDTVNYTREVSEATATSANDQGSCQAVAQVIAALKDLRNLRLDGLPTEFLESVKDTLEECGRRVALDVIKFD